MADDIRERLISTAESLMRSGRKAESLTSREIAAAAGASLGSVNYHFGSKDALVAKAAERLFADFEPRWSRVAEAARAAARTAAEAVAPGNGRAGEKAATLPALRARTEGWLDRGGRQRESARLGDGSAGWTWRHQRRGQPACAGHGSAGRPGRCRVGVGRQRQPARARDGPALRRDERGRRQPGWRHRRPRRSARTGDHPARQRRQRRQVNRK